MPEQETETILLVYIGQRINSKEKLLHWWIKVTPEQLEKGIVPTDREASRVYEGKPCKRYMTGSPGTVYEVPQVKGGTSIHSQQAKYKMLWPNDEQRFDWQTEHRIETTTYDLRKQAGKEGAADNFAPLRSLRLKYDKLVSQNQRAALLAQVIAYITGGGL